MLVAMALSPYELKMALLRCFAAAQDHQNRTNVLGRSGYPGALEYQLGVQFTTEERAIAHRALRELENDGLIQATFRDTVLPADSLEITVAGRRALEREALDDLDLALQALDLELLVDRQGAWAALYSSRPDAMRQAAHSGRELIRKVLSRLAPDTEVRGARGFHGDRVTRQDRVRLVMQKRHGRVSKSTLKVIEAQCNVVDAIYDRLSGLAHAEVPVIREHVSELLRAGETALKDLLREPTE
jgi:D-serine deaminase-like pyridoxal phosphate-dependent protein